MIKITFGSAGEMIAEKFRKRLLGNCMIFFCSQIVAVIAIHAGTLISSHPDMSTVGVCCGLQVDKHSRLPKTN